MKKLKIVSSRLVPFDDIASIQKAARQIVRTLKLQYGAEVVHFKTTSAWSQVPYVQIEIEKGDYTKEDLESVTQDVLEQFGLDIDYGIDCYSSGTFSYVDLFAGRSVKN